MGYFLPPPTSLTVVSGEKMDQMIIAPCSAILFAFVLQQKMQHSTKCEMHDGKGLPLGCVVPQTAEVFCANNDMNRFVLQFIPVL